MSLKRETIEKLTAEAESATTPMSRLAELCNHPDVVVSITAITNPKIQNWGGEVLTPEKYAFFLKVERWILELEDI